MGAHEPRLLIYSQDGLGLGHLRRTTLLATELLRTRPGLSALTVSDSPLGQFFSTARGHDYLKLPSIRKAGPGDWEAVSLSSSFADVLRLRRELLTSTIASFDPQVLLVDHMPHGAMGELLPALRALRDRPVRVVLGLRDILDAPEVVRERWHAEGAYDAVEEHYDEVLVYGSREVYDVAEEYGWSTAISQRLHYCGYVCSPPSPVVSRPVRSRYLRRRLTDNLILVMAGGGADAHPLFSALMDAASSVHAQVGCQFLMVTGPFMPPSHRRDLARRAKGLPVQLVGTVSDAPSYIAAADLVVAMAGYNTTAEILSTGTSALLVPRQGPSAEQRTRARLFAERGWVHWLPPHDLSVGAVTQAVVSALKAPADQRYRTPPDLRGREVAANRLLRVVQDIDPAGAVDAADSDATADAAHQGAPELLRVEA